MDRNIFFLDDFLTIQKPGIGLIFSRESLQFFMYHHNIPQNTQILSIQYTCIIQVASNIRLFIIITTIITKLQILFLGISTNNQLGEDADEGSEQEWQEVPKEEEERRRLKGGETRILQCPRCGTKKGHYMQAAAE